MARSLCPIARPARRSRFGATFVALALPLMTLVATAVRCPSVAAAEGDPPHSTSREYRIHYNVELPLMAIGATISASWLLRHQLAPAHCAPVCDRAGLNPLDRVAAGNWSPSLRTVADVGVATLVVSALTAIAIDGGPSSLATDGLVVAESMLFANSTAVISNVGSRRPRPFVYGESAPLDERMDGNGSLSFFSGHTATSFAAAWSLFHVVRRHHPRSTAPWWTLAAGLVVSSVVGTARVLSGDHFPTDVLGGAIVGSSMGILVPALHANNARTSPIASFAGGVAQLTIPF